MPPQLSPSPLRGEAWGEGRVLAIELPTSVGAHPVRDRSVAMYLIVRNRDHRRLKQPCQSAVAHWVCSYNGQPAFSSTMRCAALRHEPSSNPLCGEGRTSRPRRGVCHGWQALFVRAGARPKSPAAPHGLAGQSPDSAKWGCRFFGHCHHLGGYFSLGKQRKVTRPPAGGRKPAAGEPGRRIATTKAQEQSHRTPASAGVTAKECSHKAREASTPRPAPTLTQRKSEPIKVTT